MSVLNLGTIALIMLAALGYSLATIGMKLGSASMTTLAVVLMADGGKRIAQSRSKRSCPD